MFKLLVVVWTLPNTMLGIGAGMLGMLTGGRCQYRRGCLEFYGGAVKWLLARTPIRAGAMTLGHTIIGQTDASLDRARDHEHVHVRQYERWGPLFIPVYLGWSFYLWLAGRNYYLDNPFEVEAYQKESIDPEA